MGRACPTGAFWLVAISLLITAVPTLANSDPTLVDAIKMTEVPRTGNQIELPTDKHLLAVDRRSRVDIDFDKAALRNAAARHAPTGGTLGPEDPAAAKRRDNAAALLGALENYLDQWRDLQAAITEFRSLEGLGEDDRKKRIEDLQQRTRAMGKKRQAWISLAKQSILNQAVANGWSVARNEVSGEFEDEKTKEFYARESRALVPPDQLFDPAVLARILNAQFDLLSEDLKATLATVSGERVVLSVRAFLLRPQAERPLPMHVQNYDVIETPFNLQEKALLNLSREDIDELRRRYEVVNEFARFANDLRDEESDLRAALDATGDRLRAGLAGLDEHLEKLFPPTMGQAFLDDVRGLAGSDGLTPAENNALANIEAAWVAAEKVRPVLTELVVRLINDPKEVFRDLKSLQRSWDGMKGDLKQLATLIPGLPEDFKTVESRLATLAQTNAEAMVGRGEEILASLQGEFNESIAPTIAAVEKYERVAAEIKLVFAGATVRLSQVDLTGALNDYESIRPRPLDSVVPAAIFLKDYGSENGNEVRIVIEFLQADGNGFRTLESAEFRLGVRHFGGFSTLDASLIFVERIDEPDDAITTSFLASPAISLTAHYRKRIDCQGADGFAGVWNSLNPGVGINVTALSFEGRSGQYGLGFQGTLFGDILQVGYGWNLNVSSNREYWFVGVGLVDALNLASATMGGLTR